MGSVTFIMGKHPTCTRPVAERRWKLASHKVAGNRPQKFSRPGGTVDLSAIASERRWKCSSVIHFYEFPSGVLAETSLLMRIRQTLPVWLMSHVAPRYLHFTHYRRRGTVSCGYHAVILSLCC